MQMICSTFFIFLFDTQRSIEFQVFNAQLMAVQKSGVEQATHHHRVFMCGFNTWEKKEAANHHRERKKKKRFSFYYSLALFTPNRTL